MTKQESRQIRTKRDNYIERMIKHIKKRYPEAEFEVSRGPGLKKALIYVRADTDAMFEVTEPLRPIRGRAIDDGFSFYILPM